MKAIERIKHELMRYEADCLMALDDQECKACTVTVFDSLRSIIARAEKEEQKEAEEEETRRKDYTTPRLYRCDPEKNTDCRKTVCQTLCLLTSEEEYSTDGRALTREEIDEIQKEAEEDGRGTHE